MTPLPERILVPVVSKYADPNTGAADADACARHSVARQDVISIVNPQTGALLSKLNRLRECSQLENRLPIGLAHRKQRSGLAALQVSQNTAIAVDE